MSKGLTKTVAFKLTKTQLAAFEALASRQGITRSELGRLAALKLLGIQEQGQENKLQEGAGVTELQTA